MLILLIDFLNKTRYKREKRLKEIEKEPETNGLINRYNQLARRQNANIKYPALCGAYAIILLFIFYGVLLPWGIVGKMTLYVGISLFVSVLVLVCTVLLHFLASYRYDEDSEKFEVEEMLRKRRIEVLFQEELVKKNQSKHDNWADF